MRHTVSSFLHSSMNLRRAPLFLAILALTVLPAHSLRAQSEGSGIIRMEQRPAQGFSVLGNWVMLKPDGTRTTTNTPTHTYETAPVGMYLLNILPPSGMSATITLTMDGETTIIDKPQASFQLSDGSEVSLLVEYSLFLSGKVSVDSTPQGLPYTLSGPDEAIYTGVTPGFYDPMPVGLYSVTLDPLGTCNTPPPQSGRLIKDSRVVLSVQISCDALPDLPQQQTADRKYRFVTATIDGKEIIFEDVSNDTWFASHVRKALDAKVMSGYRKADGSISGRFGPSDPVTIAELAKIVHRLAHIDETHVHDEPENNGAKGAWFAPFFASAEQLDWQVFLNRSINPLRPATRAEVVATFLQALNVKRDWPTGQMFTDVSRTLPYADCVETAATGKLVGGYLDDKGKPTGKFGPTDSINRAEMAKMISAAMEIYLENSPSFQPE